MIADIVILAILVIVGICIGPDHDRGHRDRHRDRCRHGHRDAPVCPDAYVYPCVR